MGYGTKTSDERRHSVMPTVGITECNTMYVHNKVEHRAKTQFEASLGRCQLKSGECKTAMLTNRNKVSLRKVLERSDADGASPRAFMGGDRRDNDEYDEKT